MGVLIRLRETGEEFYTSGTWVARSETVEERNLHALLIAWQGGDATVREVAFAQFMDNKFGFNVEEVLLRLIDLQMKGDALLALANQIKSAAEATLSAANAAAAAAQRAEDASGRAQASADANQTGVAQAAEAAEAARAAAVVAAAEAKAAKEAVEALDPNTGGGGITVEEMTTLLSKQKVLLGNVVIDDTA